MKTTLRRLIYLLVLLCSFQYIVAQTVTDPSVQDPGYDARKKLSVQNNKGNNNRVGNNTRVGAVTNSNTSQSALDATCFIPLDTSYLPVPRNDDGFFGPIALPFSFNLYGTSYSQVWINTNGNLTFTSGYQEYVPQGFPLNGIPMVAAFWADVDTRNIAGGQIHYKLTPTRLIVTWDRVGYYSQQVDMLNTFQIIIGVQGDTLLGTGNNFKINYGDVQWATSDGFNSNEPTTVGANSGSGGNYIQVGRFSQNNSNYDGPAGANDGINYLDNQCFTFNVTNNQNIPPSVSGFTNGTNITINPGDTINVAPQFIGPEVGQTVTTLVDTQGMCRVTYSITNGAVSSVNMRVIGDTCNVGTHIIRFTATDNGNPVQSTNINFTVTVTKLNQVITFPPPVDDNGDGRITLQATAGSGLPVLYTVVSGPAFISGNTLITNGVGIVTVRASQAGNNIYNAAPPKDIALCIAPSQPGTITGNTEVCLNSQTSYNVTNITGANFTWTLDGGGTITYSGNTATVRWNTMGPHTISVSYTTNCGTAGAARALTVNVVNKTLSGSFTKMLPSDGNTNISFPINFSWFPITNAVAYDIYIWPEAGTRPATPAISNINTINFTLYGSNILEFGKTYKWQVLARSICDTLPSQVQTFRLRYLPDLIVNNIQLPASGFSGQPFSVRWEVKNTGLGSTLDRQWTDKAYLSADAILDDQDINLGTAGNVSELNPGASYVRTASFNLPQGISNNYYVIVVTNGYSQLLETDQTNNTTTSTTTAAIQLTPPPDLQVTSIIPPNNAFSGQDITVNWRVVNNGTGPSVAEAWYDNVYFSRSQQLDLATATRVGTFYHSGALSVGAGYTQSSTFKLPEGIFGGYYIHVVADTYNNVYEHASESNNTSRSDSINVILTPPIDLVVAQVTAPPTASNGESIMVKWRVENAGGSATESRNWSDAVYLSGSAVFNANTARQLGSVSRPVALSPGDGYDIERNFTIPSGITGNYYIHVITDVSNQVYEYTLENNNTTATAQAISIASPDLLVSNIVIPAADTSGHTINVSWTVRNNGTGSLYNQSISDRIVLSTATTFNEANSILLKQFSWNTTGLQAGDDTVHQTTVTLPEGISGNYYIYIQTDYGNAVYETDNTNNMRRSTGSLAVTLGPWADMQVTAITFTDTATAADIVPVTYTVANRGNKTVNGITWKDKIFLSLKPQWDSLASTFIREMPQTRAVGKDSSYQVSTTIRMPNDAKDTTYYLYVFTDAARDIYEHTDEGNNIRRSNPVFIKKYPPVDLIVTSISAPDSGSSGNPIKIRWSVKNQGKAVTLQTQWSDALYLSADTVFDNSDRLVKDFTHRGALPVDSSYTDDQSFILPNGISGSYYLMLVTDRSNLNNDADRSNNYKLIRQSSGGGGGGENEPIPIYIVLTTPPDLEVTALNVPDEGTAGQPVKVKWTVKNTGAGVTAANAWTDKIYLSTNLELDGSDQIIGSYTRSGALEPGASYTDSLQAFLPITAVGNYVLIFKTDANDNVYEHGAEVNTSTGLITVSRAALSDLIVTDVVAPPNAAAGEQITLQWKIKNIGVNPAIGYMQQGVYLSVDSVKDINDILLGSPDTYFNLVPQAEMTQSITAELKGVALRNYHALIHTDVLNNISEDNDANNIGISVQPIQITVDKLELGVLTQRGLPVNREVYYRIEIPDSLAGESLLVTLKGDSARGNNELYLRFGEVPTRAVHDFAFNEPYQASQEIIVPALQAGTYYIMVYGNTTGTTPQPISLLANILNFEIRSVDAQKGGNTGPVTLQIKGSKLGTVTQVRLRSAQGVIVADSIRVTNPTSIFARFNLKGAALAVYDVVAENGEGDTTVLQSGFTVEPGTASSLLTNVLTPPNTRPSNVISITVQFTNAGNTDLINPVLKLTSLSGAPIAFNATELTNNTKELTLKLQELNGPPGILRPGASGTIIVYAKATTALGFTLFQSVNQ